jgi:polyisoprenoid-binding protein YceI
MTRTTWLALFAAALLVGCAAETESTSTPTDAQLSDSSASVDTESDASAEDNSADAPAADSSETPAAGNEVALTPDNTKIQFVGIHVGDKPDPRTGTFGQFNGTATVGDSGLQSITIEIDTTSISTEMDKLTNHLKSADFFDVNQFRTATFKSTSIEAAEDTVTITGDLTLLGNTQSISFPATVSTTDGLTLKAEFTIDRTQFGMEYGTDNVEKEVSMTVTVGG